MSGLRIDIELPAGLRLEESENEAVLTIPERGMFETIVPVGVRSAKSKLTVRAGAGSRARLVLDYEFEGGLEADFHLEAGACMDVFHLDCQQRDSSLVTKSLYELKKHASVNVLTLASGSEARVEHWVRFLEPHGFASVKGLSLLGEKANVAHRVTAEHAVGHCVSRQFYKSILADSAKAAFESRVEVAKGADKSDSRQLNKNLLLSKTAAAVSRPELKIHADDVSCAHGSATGELRQEELFYMQSRGIGRAFARLVMTEGFAKEVLEEIPEIPLRGELEELVRLKITELVKA
jgi:Fe-S cluster assembly scaffold protein SufB